MRRGLKALNRLSFMIKHGGKRRGSGRKRIHSRGVAHRIREKVSGRTPLHVNFKYRSSIRNKQTLRLLKRAIHNARLQGLKIIHFSLQSNHVHLIIEADTNSTLSRGMRSLTITMAKGLRLGSIQIARYHLHVLRTLKETRNAVHYVLFNQQRHDKKKNSEVNDYSSLLSLSHALRLCQEYAQKHRISLRINPGEGWLADPAGSYLLRCVLAP